MRVDVKVYPLFLCLKIRELPLFYHMKLGLNWDLKIHFVDTFIKNWDWKNRTYSPTLRRKYECKKGNWYIPVR